MKTCTKCRVHKRLNEFTPNRRMKDGRDSWCRKCRGDQRRRGLMTSEQIEEENAKARNRRNRTPEQKLANQDRQHRNRYGIGLDVRDTILRAQGNKCGCCGRPDSGWKGDWHTDHDHVTGQVRGVLCHYCNKLLGMLGDSVEGIEQATLLFLSYLERASRFRNHH